MLKLGLCSAFRRQAVSRDAHTKTRRAFAQHKQSSKTTCASTHVVQWQDLHHSVPLECANQTPRREPHGAPSGGGQGRSRCAHRRRCRLSCRQCPMRERTPPLHPTRHGSPAPSATGHIRLGGIQVSRLQLDLYVHLGSDMDTSDVLPSNIKRRCVCCRPRIPWSGFLRVIRITQSINMAVVCLDGLHHIHAS